MLSIRLSNHILREKLQRLKDKESSCKALKTELSWMVYTNVSCVLAVQPHAQAIGGYQIDILDLLFSNKLTDGLLTPEMSIPKKESNILLMILDWMNANKSECVLSHAPRDSTPRNPCPICSMPLKNIERKESMMRYSD